MEDFNSKRLTWSISIIIILGILELVNFQSSEDRVLGHDNLTEPFGWISNDKEGYWLKLNS